MSDLISMYIFTHKNNLFLKKSFSKMNEIALILCLLATNIHITSKKSLSIGNIHPINTKCIENQPDMI